MLRHPSAEEDAWRAHRERQTLGREASRILSRIKSSLARLGIRGFSPTGRKAAERLGELRSGEGEAIPPSSLAELKRELARLALLRAQSREIAAERVKRLAEAPDIPAHRMTVQLTQVRGLGLETGVSVLAAALAVCDSRDGLSGRDVLLAVALGLDVSCRVALASTLDRGWHRTAAIGVFGATAAASKLHGLTPEQMLNAFGIAYSHAPAIASAFWTER